METPLDKMRYEVTEPNVWPETDDAAFDYGFKKVFQAGFEIRRNIGRAFVKSVARALNMPKLPALFVDDEFSAMGLRRYLQRSE